MKLLVPVANAPEALELNLQVLSHGLLNDVEYTWAYTPRREDWMNGVQTPGTVEFDFVDAQWVTFFGLKWAKA
jgi:hypothetical protein